MKLNFFFDAQKNSNMMFTFCQDWYKGMKW